MKQISIKINAPLHSRLKQKAREEGRKIFSLVEILIERGLEVSKGLNG